MSDKFLSVTIDGQRLDVDVENFPFSLSYQLEDGDDFHTKQGATSLDVVTVLNGNNGALINSLDETNVVDMSADESFEKPRAGVIRSGGYELLAGKALLKGVSRSNGNYKAKWNFYGGNKDWSIPAGALTLQDCINPAPFVYNHAVVENSWNFDGRSESLDYVFAPVRYSTPFGSNVDEWSGKDIVITIYDLRPAISVYWMLYRGFKALGYTIRSTFMDSNYFRRLVEPWTFGNFLLIDSSIFDVYKFAANTPDNVREVPNTDNNFANAYFDNRYMDLKVTNDSTGGMFDNSNTYTYANPSMTWTYPASATSKVITGLVCTIVVDWQMVGIVNPKVWIDWFVNGSLKSHDQLINIEGQKLGRSEAYSGEFASDFEYELNPGDVVTAKVMLDMFAPPNSLIRFTAKQYISEFKLLYYKAAINSSLRLDKYNKFKNYKFTDLLKGVKECFDLQFTTDTQRKTVTIEPMFPYSITTDINDRADGFLRSDAPQDWTNMEDIERDGEFELVSDFDREWYFKMKEDGSDGALKKIQDRYQSTIGAGKYVMPERNISGTKEITNTFFSPLMHVQAQQLGDITGIIPQIPCIYPENISNTSSTESDNVFEPKLAYYKGITSGVGGWKYYNEIKQVVVKNDIPFMFAVNYQQGGESDPVLSYGDQNISGTIAPGLLKRFYLPRMAMYRHGRRMKAFVRLDCADFFGPVFRRMVQIKVSKYILMEMNGFQPLKDDSTGVTMWRWAPIIQKDFDNTFPSIPAVIDDAVTSNPFDFKHVQHLILFSDLPK